MRARTAGVWLIASAVAASSFTFHRVVIQDPSTNFYPEFSGVALYLSDAMWVAGLMVWTAGRLAARDSPLTVGPRPVFAALVILTLLSFVSILWALDAGQAAFASIRLAVLLAGYFVVANEWRAFFIPFVSLTAIAAALHTVVALGQIANGGPLDIQWIGELRPGWEGYGGIGRPVGYGLGFNPNPVGAAIALPAVTIFARYLVSNASRDFAASFLLLGVGLAAGTLATVARAAMLGSGIGLITVAAVTVRGDGAEALARVRRAVPTALLVITAACALALILGLSPGRWRFARSSFSGEALLLSAASRSQDLNTGALVLRAHSWAGVGAGNYPVAVKSIWFPSAWSPKIVPVHNVSVLLWSELGIIGFSCWIAILLVIASEIGRRLYRPRAGRLPDSVVWMAPLSTMLGVSFFDFTPWATQDGRLAFIALLGAWAGAVSGEQLSCDRTSTARRAGR